MKKSMFVRFTRPLIAAVFFLALFSSVQAQELDAAGAAADKSTADTVIAERGGATITLAELDAKVRTMPPELRGGYLTDPQRIGRMLDAMLLSKQVAMEAEAAGYGNDPELIADLQLLRSERMANRFISDKMNAIKEPNYELLAKERYQANPAAYRGPRRIDVRHILISTNGHDEAWSKDLAQQIRNRVDAGEDFAKVIEEMSAAHADSVKTDLISNIDLGKVDPVFAEAVLAIENVGGYAGPVRSRFGYHVVRLEQRIDGVVPPFESVKAQIITKLRNDFLNAQRSTFLQERSMHEFKFNEAAVATLPSRYAKTVKESEGAAQAFGQPTGSEVDSASATSGIKE